VLVELLAGLVDGDDSGEVHGIGGDTKSLDELECGGRVEATGRAVRDGSVRG
jgi:hypothetical protein